MKFHLMQTGVVGRRAEIEQGMARQRPERTSDSSQEVRGYVQLSPTSWGYFGYCQLRHHLQIEGFEANNHPAVDVQLSSSGSTRQAPARRHMGLYHDDHNPVRVAEEIATLDHMLTGPALLTGFRVDTTPAGSTRTDQGWCRGNDAGQRQGP
jgi:hypothetical protein